MAPSENPYDKLAYRAGTFPETHPGNLGALAALFGMRPAPPERCRVLELGCGSGANLLPLAEALPASTFVGVDLARRPIEDGRRDVERLGLENLDLQQRDILDIELEPGAYDYIVAHGVYSWVPPAVQDKLLAVIGRGLAPHGVGYVSYNALPGGYLRRAARDAMSFHTRGLDDPKARLAQARAIAAFIAEASPATAGAYKQMMLNQVERLGRLDDEYLFHDDLSEHNEALYFEEFIRRAASHGLRYLSEARFHETQDRPLSASARTMLAGVDDIVTREQYLDFCVGRSFRRTLVVREDVELERRLDGDVARRFFARTHARRVSTDPADLGSGVVERFQHPDGVVMGLDGPLAKAAMTTLCDAAPVALSFAELIAAAMARLPPAERAEVGADAAREEREVGELLLAAYGGDMVKLGLHRPSRMTKVAGARPEVRPLARAQAAAGPGVTNLWHENVRIDDPTTRWVLAKLDGSLERPALAASLASAIATGELPSPKEAPADAGEQLSRVLNGLGGLGFLVA